MSLDRQHFAAARLWAAHRFPYLASALFAATVVEREGVGGDGIAVDVRWRLYVDPVKAKEWTVSELGALLVHHTGHLVRDHAGRAETLGITASTAVPWCVAADAELNDDLADVGLAIPGQAILPEHLGFERGRLAEEYFHRQMAKPQPEDAPTSDHGSGSHGQPSEWEDGDSAGTGEKGDAGEGGEQEGRDKDANQGHGQEAGDRDPGLSRHEADLLRASTANQILDALRLGSSDVPANWKRWASELLAPTIDWRRTLAAEVRRGVQSVAGAVDYTYRRPSRRAAAAPTIVLPALQKPVPEVAVVCDTSGSMGEPELARVLAEVEGLLASIGLRGSGVRVLAVDTAVQTSRRVSTARQVDLVGGGGTDMRTGIEAAAALRPRPSVLVILTDGLTPWPAAGPRGLRVVIGLMTPAYNGRYPRTPAAPPWARVVRIDDVHARA